MQQRNDLMEAKKAEIIQLIHQSAPNNQTPEIIAFLFDSGSIKMTPPQEPPVTIHMITLDSLNKYQRGSSIKPGNIIINIRELMDSVPEIVASVVGITIDMPLLKICALLNIWKTLRNVMTIKIEKMHAIVIMALWKNCNREQIVTADRGFECAKKLFMEHYKEEFTKESYNEIIDHLVNIGSIEWSNGDLWLREWISRKYCD